MKLERNQSNGKSIEKLTVSPVIYMLLLREGVARKGTEKTIGTGHPALANSISKPQIKRSV